MWYTVGIAVLVVIVILVLLALASRFNWNPLDRISAPSGTTPPATTTDATTGA